MSCCSFSVSMSYMMRQDEGRTSRLADHSRISELFWKSLFLRYSWNQDFGAHFLTTKPATEYWNVLRNRLLIYSCWNQHCRCDVQSVEYLVNPFKAMPFWTRGLLHGLLTNHLGNQHLFSKESLTCDGKETVWVPGRIRKYFLTKKLCSVQMGTKTPGHYDHIIQGLRSKY